MTLPQKPVKISTLVKDQSITAAEHRKLKSAQRMLHRIAGGMSDKALNWIENEIDTSGPKAYDASKLVLEYAMGKPKQAVDVTAKVEHSHLVHMSALKEMVDLQIEQNRVKVESLPSYKPLITLDNSDPPTKQPVKSSADSIEPASPDSDEEPPTPVEVPAPGCCDME